MSYSESLANLQAMIVIFLKSSASLYHSFENKTWHLIEQGIRHYSSLIGARITLKRSFQIINLKSLEK